MSKISNWRPMRERMVVRGTSTGRFPADKLKLNATPPSLPEARRLVQAFRTANPEIIEVREFYAKVLDSRFGGE